MNLIKELIQFLKARRVNISLRKWNDYQYFIIIDAVKVIEK